MGACMVSSYRIRVREGMRWKSSGEIKDGGGMSRKKGSKEEEEIKVGSRGGGKRREWSVIEKNCCSFH